MSSKIRVLDEQTINQIAAGEVIENPSSVVKELVENAIDALSSEICVEIRGGGRQLIRISDNGIGMNADDALLCLERHATSKIRDIEDIHSIYTMGFRGEAIPSIASISKFTLLTCPKETNGTGTMVIVDGGKILQSTPVTHSQGTTVEVKSLFFNVPVRKKFQKSPTYDANEILKIISSIALGHPGIKFTLINDQKIVLSTVAPVKGEGFLDSLKNRIESILGVDFCQSMCAVDMEKGEYKLQGFVSLPSYSRPNRTGQYLFINQRAVMSPLVSYAVREGYGTSLSANNRYPVFVLHLTMPGSLVDVNVHPQKREVRLRQEQDLKEMVLRAVQKALQQQGSFVSREPAAPVSFEREPFSSRPQFFEKPDAATFIPFAEMPKYEPVIRDTAELTTRPAPSRTVEAPLFPAYEGNKKVAPRVLGTVNRYIILDAAALEGSCFQGGREGICLVDQRAAQSRVIFERLMERAPNQEAAVQSLLVPYTFELTPVESALLLENLEGLNEMGISIRQLKDCSFIVDGLPHHFGNTDLQTLVQELVNGMQEFQDKTMFKKEQEKRIALAASRASVSVRRRLSVEEGQALVNALAACKMPSQCPQGKPMYVVVSFDELEKRFR